MKLTCYNNDMVKIAGVTLTELMIVTFIVTITATVALPGLSNFWQGNRTESVSEQLVQHLIFARSQAISSGEMVTFCPIQANKCVQDWNKDIILFYDNNQDQQQTSDEQSIAHLQLISRHDSLTFPYAGITFLPNGTIAANNGIFHFQPNQQNEHEIKIEVLLSGRYQILE